MGLDSDSYTSKDLNGVNRDIDAEFGIDVAVGIYEHFKGLQISFPVRLLYKKYVLNQI